MKNSHVKSILGLGSVLALAIGLGSSAFAGPGPQHWQQQEQLRAANAAKKAATTQAEKPAAATAMACPSCKTKVYEETAQPNVVDKTRPRVVKVGVRHYCDSCKGTITRLPGGVNSEMQHNHGACATASCCTVT